MPPSNPREVELTRNAQEIEALDLDAPAAEDDREEPRDADEDRKSRDSPFPRCNADIERQNP